MVKMRVRVSKSCVMSTRVPTKIGVQGSGCVWSELTQCHRSVLRPTKETEIDRGRI